MYMKEGAVNGCGVRVLIADLVPGVPVVPVYDLSFNLFHSYASVKGGSYDVLLEDVRNGKPWGNDSRVPLASIWVKAANMPATVPLNGLHPSEDKGFFLYAADVERVTALFLAVGQGESISVGTRRKDAKTERIFTGPIKLEAAEVAELMQCLSELHSAVTKELEAQPK